VTAHPHGNVVRLVDREGQLVGEGCSGCLELAKKISVMAGKITRLENEQTERLGLAADAPLIMDVLQHHKRVLSPRSRIVRGGPAWKNVKARLLDVDAETEKPAFTVLHLKAAIVGLSMSDWHRQRGKVQAAWLFENPDRVQEFIANATSFKRDTGVSALDIVDELGRGGFEKLAARCDCCGHLRLDHERERPELDLWDPPCAVHGCSCPGFEDFDWRVTVRLAELERERAA
jgi:hypothetical protein